jgi:peptidoglycan/xylan/chitin deacetylase (PgdA/CDA1 family)
MAGARSLGLRVISACGGAALARRFYRGRGRILAYHGVDPRQDPASNFDGFQVEPQVFAAQLDHLGRHFHVMPLSELVSGLAGERSLPDRAVAITFDDGYANNLQHAAPLLRARGFPATFFVTTAFLDGTQSPWWYRVRACLPPAAAIVAEARLKSLSAADRNAEVSELEARREVPGAGAPYPFLDWDGARELVRQGFQVAAHTVTHPALAREDQAAQRHEIETSVRRVQQETGCPADVFSYPYGGGDAYDGRVREWVRAAGCRAALTTRSSLARPGDDPFALPPPQRHGAASGISFAALVSACGAACPAMADGRANSPRRVMLTHLTDALPRGIILGV